MDARRGTVTHRTTTDIITDRMHRVKPDSQLTFNIIDSQFQL